MKAEHHPTLELTLQVARIGSWLKVWDHALDHGPIGMKQHTAICRVMTQPTFGTRPCLVNGMWKCTRKPHCLSTYWETICVTFPRVFRTYLLMMMYVTTLFMDCIDMTILLEVGSSCYKLLYPSVFLDHVSPHYNPKGVKSYETLNLWTQSHPHRYKYFSQW